MIDQDLTISPHRRSRRSVTTAAMGTVVSLLLGSGLLAQVSDSIRSEDNATQSGTLAPDPSGGEGLVAALVGNTVSCNGTTDVTDGPLPAIVTDSTASTAALSTPGASFFVQQTTDTCVRNAGAASGRLMVTFDQILSSEVAECEVPEADAGDTTCTDGSDGEFEDVISAAFRPLPGNACSGVSNQRLPFNQISTAGLTIDDAFAPGDTCRFYLQLYISADATEEQRLIAQSDRLQWDIVLTLEDALVP